MKRLLVLTALLSAIQASASPLDDRIRQVSLFFQAMDDAYYQTRTDHPETEAYSEALWPCVVFTGEPTDMPNWVGITFSGSQCPLKYKRLLSNSTGSLQAHFETNNSKLLSHIPVESLLFTGHLDQSNQNLVEKYKTTGLATYYFSDSPEVLNADIVSTIILDKSGGEKKPKSIRELTAKFSFDINSPVTLTYRLESTTDKFNRTCTVDKQTMDCQQFFKTFGPVQHFGNW